MGFWLFPETYTKNTECNENKEMWYDCHWYHCSNEGDASNFMKLYDLQQWEYYISFNEFAF